MAAMARSLGLLAVGLLAKACSGRPATVKPNIIMLFVDVRAHQ